MSGRRATIAAWALCALAVLAASAALALWAADAGSISLLPDGRKPTGGVATSILDLVLVAAFGVVGAVVASRRPSNPVGWFLSGLPVLLALGVLGESLYWHAVVAHSADAGYARLGIWLSNWWWVPAVYWSSFARMTRSVSWWPGGVETGGVHIHHLVFGICLMLLCGFLAFAAALGSPWWHLIAVGFGVGAGFTLDEFALWVRLEDVYWSEEGRASFDAVVVAFAFAALVVMGTRGPLASTSRRPSGGRRAW